MAVSYTSRLAYASVAPKLVGFRLEVFTAIKGWKGLGPTIEDLHLHLGRKEGSICGRINELRKAGAIIDGPFKENLGGGRARTYLAVAWHEDPAPADPQLDLFGNPSDRRGPGAYSAA
jgi:hypothetical protein